MANYIADVMSKKLDDKYLVSTISGAWDVLTEPEYKSLITYQAEKDPDLYKRLEEEGIILTKGNIELIKNRLRQRYSFLCEPVALHIIVATNRCTHRCIYCHAASPAPELTGVQDMSKETADNVSDFILSSTAKVLSAEFQGGESLLNLEIVKYIAGKLEKERGDKRIIYRLVTNLSGMTEEIFTDLLKMGFNVVTSLDGPKELHNKQRLMANTNSYDNVIKWFDYARERFNKNIGTLATTTRYSLEYGAKAIIGEYVKHKIYHIRLRELNLSGATIPHWKEIGYTPEEYFDFWKEGVDYCIQLYEQGIPMREDMTTIILERLLSPAGGVYMCYRSPCGAGINQVSYDPAGDIYFCDASRSFGESFTIGNVSEMTYEDLITKTKGLRGLSNLNTPCRQCVWSPYCGTCLLQPSGKEEGFIPIKLRDFHCQLRQKQLEYVVKLLLGEHKNTLLEWWEATSRMSGRSVDLDYQPKV
ncbi:MAG: SPASM domain-containing protein [Planctomycetes bacterium]|nr:SPASM domain-containing protein [Planctomycetota bacterium]